jgi:hypothetical protein
MSWLLISYAHTPPFSQVILQDDCGETKPQLASTPANRHKKMPSWMYFLGFIENEASFNLDVSRLCGNCLQIDPEIGDRLFLSAMFVFRAQIDLSLVIKKRSDKF